MFYGYKCVIFFLAALKKDALKVTSNLSYYTMQSASFNPVKIIAKIYLMLMYHPQEMEVIHSNTMVLLS